MRTTRGRDAHLYPRAYGASLSHSPQPDIAHRVAQTAGKTEKTKPKKYMKSKGIAGDKISYASYGPHQPKTSKAQSRRVELVVVVDE